MVATVVPNASGRLIKQLKRIKITGIDPHDFFINGPGLIEISRLMERQTLLQRRSYHTRCSRGDRGPQPGCPLGDCGLTGGIWRFFRHWKLRFQLRF